MKLILSVLLFSAAFAAFAVTSAELTHGATTDEATKCDFSLEITGTDMLANPGAAQTETVNLALYNKAKDKGIGIIVSQEYIVDPNDATAFITNGDPSCDVQYGTIEDGTADYSSVGSGACEVASGHSATSITLTLDALVPTFISSTFVAADVNLTATATAGALTFINAPVYKYDQNVAVDADISTSGTALTLTYVAATNSRMLADDDDADSDAETYEGDPPTKGCSALWSTYYTSNSMATSGLVCLAGAAAFF